MGALPNGIQPSWKEYRLDNKEVWDIISWGALTHPSVMRNKDDSVTGILRYRPLPQGNADAPIQLPPFSRGWVMNIETQQGAKGAEHFLILTWNPFKSLGSGMVENTLEKGIMLPLEQMERRMYAILQELCKRFPKEAEAKILSYQEIVDTLVWTLSHGRYRVPMPEVPVDLDCYLTFDFAADFSKNLITFGRETFLVLTLPAFVGAREKTLLRLTGEMHASGIPTRHVQRILFFSEEEAEGERSGQNRMGRWCKSRQYIKDIIEEPLHGKFYGYYNNTLVALVPSDNYQKIVAYLRKLFYDTEEFYVIENFNAKQRWWGTIPAQFRAGVLPPICAFHSLEELLAGSEAEQAEAPIEEEPLLVSITHDETTRA